MSTSEMEDEMSIKNKKLRKFLRPVHLIPQKKYPFTPGMKVICTRSFGEEMKMVIKIVGVDPHEVNYEVGETAFVEWLPTDKIYKKHKFDGAEHGMVVRGRVSGVGDGLHWVPMPFWKPAPLDEGAQKLNDTFKVK
jgi:hypothetical protein